MKNLINSEAELKKGVSVHMLKRRWKLRIIYKNKSYLLTYWSHIILSACSFTVYYGLFFDVRKQLCLDAVIWA